MTDLDLSNDQVGRLTALAEVLVPGTATMPAPAALDAWEGLVRRAVRACGHGAELILRAVDGVDPAVDWDAAQAFATKDPEAFQVASQLVSAAYYMAPAVLAEIKYPTERRHPPRSEDFADEFTTGVLEPVMRRDPRYRDSTGHGAPTKASPGD